MQYLFVPYHIALALKEKGFDESCLSHYGNNKWLEPMQYSDSCKNSVLSKLNWTAAPLYQQVQEWLLEKHKINVWAMPSYNSEGMTWFAGIFCYDKVGNHVLTYIQDEDIAPTFNTLGLAANKIFDTPKEALTKAIEEALKLI